MRTRLGEEPHPACGIFILGLTINNAIDRADGADPRPANRGCCLLNTFGEEIFMYVAVTLQVEQQEATMSMDAQQMS